MWVMALILGVYARSIQGIWGAILAFVGMATLNGICQHCYLYFTRHNESNIEGEDSLDNVLGTLRKIRWVLFIVLLLVIAMSGVAFGYNRSFIS